MAVTMATATTTPLAPWLAHARRVVYGALDDLAEPADLDEDLWIEWTVRHGAEDTQSLDETSLDAAWIFTLEAMELLDLYVRVDYHAGWTWLLETLEMSVYVPLLDELPGKIFPKHSVNWDAVGASAQLAELLVLAIPDDRHTPTFPAVRAEMMRRWGMTHRGPDDRIRVGFEVNLDELEDGDGVVAGLEQLVQLAALAHDPAQRQLQEQLRQADTRAHSTLVPPAATTAASSRRTEAGATFCFDRIELNTSDVALTDAMLIHLQAIQRYGVQLSALNLEQTDVPADRLSLPVVVDVLRSLWTPTMGLLVSRPLPPSTFDAFCSTIASSPRLYDVSFTVTSGHDQYWAWLAYALFSGDVTNRLEYVHLGVDQLTTQDVATVAHVLHARDPIAALSPVRLGSDEAADRLLLLQRERHVVDVRPNTTGLVRSRNAAAQLTAVSIDTRGAVNLRVVDESFSPTHVCVLYPGAGLCWVPRDAIVARRVLPPRDRRVLLRRIGLELGAETSLAVVLALLQLIGPLTRILLLYMPLGGVLPDEFLRDVLVACPHLERLDLFMATVTGFTWLTENDAVRLESLRLTRVRCLHPDGYVPLFTALRNTSSRLSRVLRELSIRTERHHVQPAWPALIEMLSRNYRLERVFVRTHDTRTDPDDNVATLASELRDYDGQPLHVRAAPLALRHRLALLSVWVHRTDLPELDAALVAIVFALAAPTKTRACGLMRTLQQTRAMR